MPLILFMMDRLWASSRSERRGSAFQGWPLLNKLDLMNITQSPMAPATYGMLPREKRFLTPFPARC